MKQCAQIDTEKRLNNREVAYGAGGRHQRKHTNLLYQTDSGSDGVMDGQTDFPRVVGIKQVAIILVRTEKAVRRMWEKGKTSALGIALSKSTRRVSPLKRDVGIGQRAGAEIRRPKGEAPLNEGWSKGIGATV